MNAIANIWKQPKTSVVGVLIALITIAGVLSQQGITLGTAGNGTVVSLAGALATALLGLLARDPSAPRAAGGSTGTQKSGASALILLLMLSPLPGLGGCSAKSVAQEIVNWTPALQSAVSTVDSTGALLDPADATLFAAATSGFDAASNLLAAQAKSYLANPTTSTLAQLQTQIVVLEQQVNASLLAAAKIVQPASQQHALNALDAVATAVSAILALVQSISSKAAVARMAAQAPIKLSAVQPYLDRKGAIQMVARHYGEAPGNATVQVALAESAVQHAGF
jgi:hypothetical protein